MRWLVPLIIEINVGQHLIDLIVDESRVSSFEGAEHSEMVLWSQVMEKDIVLGAYTDHGPQRVHVSKYIHAKHFSCSFRLFD